MRNCEIKNTHSSLSNDGQKMSSFLRTILFPNVIKVIKSRGLRWGGHVARMEAARSAFKILTGTPAGKIPLDKPRCRWEDNIRMDLKQIGRPTHTRN